MEKARALCGAKKYADAAAIFSVLACDETPEMADCAAAARGQLGELEGLARACLGRAEDAHAAQDHLKELDELAALPRDFPFSASVGEARRRIGVLKSFPEVAALLELQEAEKLEKAGQLLRAAEAYRAIAANGNYRGAPAAKQAAAKLEGLRRDETASAQLKREAQAQADREAPELMDLAKQLARNGNYERAAAKYRQIIEQFPGTPHAERAREELERLP